MNWSAAAPFLIAAEAATVAAPESWALTLANYGVATTMLGWFMWKDKLDREDRKQEKIDQQRRHEENLAASKRIEDAFRTNTMSIIVGISAMKNIDSQYSELLRKIQDENNSK